MKLIAVFLVFSLAFIGAQQVPDLKNDPKFLEASSLFSPSKSCDDQLIEPLAILLYPVPLTYAAMCDQSVLYYHGCRDPNLIECNKMFNNEETCGNYMYWIDAFVVEGRTFTCSVTFDNLTDIQRNQGGYECTIIEADRNLTRALLDLQEYLKLPKEITCSDMKLQIQEILTVLESCESKVIEGLVQEFFNQVVSASPCSDKKESGGGASALSSGMILISATIFYTVISFIS